MLAPYALEKRLYAALILFGAGLRVGGFWTPSLWLDELGTFYVASAPDLGALLERAAIERHPPVYFLFVRLFLHLGASELALRLPSVLCGLASLAVLMATLKRAAGPRAALYGGVVYALSSNAIYHAQEARMYSLALLGTTLSIYCFVRVLEGGGRWSLTAYAASTALACSTQIVYCSVLIGETVAAGFLFSRAHPKADAGLRATLRHLLVVQGIVFVLLAPLAPLALSAGAQREQLYGWVKGPGLRWALSGLRYPYTGLSVAALAVGLIWLWRRRERLRFSDPVERGLVLLGVIYATFALAAALAAALGPVNILSPRYLLPSLVGVIIFVALAAVKADDPAIRQVLWTYTLLLATLHVLVAWRGGPRISAPHEDWRGAIAWIEQQYQPGDLVLVRSGFTTVRVLSPGVPGSVEYLLSPLGFYDRRSMEAVALPWTAAELPASPFTPAAVRERAGRAERVFALVNLQITYWDWDLFERWLPGQARRREARRFQLLEARVYRR